MKCFIKKEVFTTYRNEMMNCVKIRISEVDPNRSDCESVALSTSSNDDRRLKSVDQWRNFSGRRCVSR